MCSYRAEGLFAARIDHVTIVAFESFKHERPGRRRYQQFGRIPTVLATGALLRTRDPALEPHEGAGLRWERYAFSDGDCQRAPNQQAVIKAVLGQSLTADALTHRANISGLVRVIAPYLCV